MSAERFRFNNRHEKLGYNIALSDGEIKEVEEQFKKLFELKDDIEKNIDDIRRKYNNQINDYNKEIDSIEAELKEILNNKAFGVRQYFSWIDIAKLLFFTTINLITSTFAIEQYYSDLIPIKYLLYLTILLIIFFIGTVFSRSIIRRYILGHYVWNAMIAICLISCLVMVLWLPWISFMVLVLSLLYPIIFIGLSFINHDYADKQVMLSSLKRQRNVLAEKGIDMMTSKTNESLEIIRSAINDFRDITYGYICGKSIFK